MMQKSLHWRCCRFDALSTTELDAIYRARQQVFVVEQACAYLDADGVDGGSWHLAAWRADWPVPVAYARLVAPGLKYAEASIGRVLTDAAARGTGLGRDLMARAVVECRAVFPGLGIRISAQAHLAAFYAGFGFVAEGAPYLEDGIPHVEMALPAA